MIERINVCAHPQCSTVIGPYLVYCTTHAATFNNMPQIPPTHKPIKGLGDIIGTGTLKIAEAQVQDKKKSMSFRYPKYYKDVSHLTEIDVYGVHSLFNIQDPSGCIQHASKKLLLSGVRTGGKSKFKDIEEARDTLNRWLELNPETKEITNV